ncbi:glutathione S-transferase theta-1-like isoform X1 [Schistocerca serialis cubense]|uniref:glutathione S-transferase theta-1-like isoform X1 n=1 Tax=Schistocerca serialis cubense TaxID=2023355 RepID=UPI00214E7E5A|nr:glutathione S-transferase theta-1-like isoform X1 [Schistocerca serialis cubense]XP_049937279.1 glutathione S-transferase theta-1-like isoform X1 [Schistocerca serialis cubense]
MSLKVYYDLLSQPSRAVVLFLLANDIPFVAREINVLHGEQFSEEFAKLNPMKKVPVIKDGEFTLTESVGILRYLCREKNVPDHWYPADSKKQARVDEYLEWQHTNTRSNCALYFLNKFMLPGIKGTPPNPETVARRERKMVETLNEVEEIWLNNKSYLAGDKISIADLLGACEIEQTRMAGYNPCEGRPKLAAWLERVRHDTLPHYDSVHAIVRKVTDKYGGVAPASFSKL